MPELLHPGVYVLELPAAVKPIEGVSTSTAGFVGVADRGPVPGFPMPFGKPARPPLVTSFAEFTRVFGGYRRDSYLAYAVQSFFDNGGRRAYISRVVVADDPEDDEAPRNARLAAVGLADREATPRSTVAVVARTPGAWANRYGIRVSTSGRNPDTRFRLVVVESGIPVESFDDLSMDPDSDDYVEARVNASSELVMVAATLPEGVSTADARPAETDDAQVLDLTGDDDEPSMSVSSPVLLGAPLTITTRRDAASPTFTLDVSQDGVLLESFDRLSMNPALGSFVERKVNPASRLVAVEVPEIDPETADFAALRPADGSRTFASPGLPSGLEFPGGALTAGPGADGRIPGSDDLHLLGRADLGTGLHAFDGVDDVSILAIPGGGSDLIISGGMAYCRNRPLQDAFFVADLGLLDPDTARRPGSVPDVDDRDAARDAVRSLSTPNDYGAVYFPWIRTSDPVGRGRNPTIALPPSGFVAGLYARIDNSRGVFKAPAGTEAGLAGALDLCADIQDADQDVLNPIGLNVLRRFPGYGVVSWGTRTLATDPAWRYIPVRRTAIFLRASIYRGIQWAVFEPNDEPLWAELRLNVRSFMLTQFRAGAFQGATPADAFFVRCDASTTTQQDIDLGIVNILVGFAPLRPAEFVVLKLSQKVNQPT